MLTSQTHAPTIKLRKQHCRGNLPRAINPVASAKTPTRESDDLKVIKGIGSVIEKALNVRGIYHYYQIVNFTATDINWVNSELDFPGRIEREDWIEQAKRLVALQDAQNLGGGISDDMKPALLDQPINGVADDFKRIKGIGLVLEQALHELGIYHYSQLATLTTDNVKWIEHHIGFLGRVKRENWKAQSYALANGKVTEYSSRFDKGETPYKRGHVHK